jgi:hypothetical protein
MTEEPNVTTYAPAAHRAWTARRFGGIALLGGLGIFVGLIVYNITISTEAGATLNSGAGVVGALLSIVLLLGGLTALVVGVVGAAVALLRS